MIQRPYLQIIKSRIETEPRRFIQVIYGPRQVGKSTLIYQFSKQTGLPCHIVSADDIQGSWESWLSTQWEAARLKLAASEKKEAVLIIDEIQKLDNWSETVKKEWDADTRDDIRLKVILLGSSRLLLQTGLTESLAGRFETIYIGHWTYAEMHEAFGFTPEEYVWFGGYPGAAQLKDDELRWKQYVLNSIIESSISKDILMLSRVDKPALMKRLFELGCAYSGQVLSFTKVMGQLLDAGNTTTLSHYLDLLDTAGLLGGLEKYSPGMLRKRSSSPKFQVYNTALLSAQQPLTRLQVRHQPEVWGRWVESAVGAHLLNASIYYNFKLSYWRQGNNEIDFVLKYQGKTIGLEVKSGNTQTGKGMSEFVKQMQPDKMLMIGKSGIPWEDLLKTDVLKLF